MAEAETFEHDAGNLIEQYHSYWLGLNTSEQSLLEDFISSPMHKCNRQAQELGAYLSTLFKNNLKAQYLSIIVLIFIIILLNNCCIVLLFVLHF